MLRMEEKGKSVGLVVMENNKIKKLFVEDGVFTVVNEDDFSHEILCEKVTLNSVLVDRWGNWCPVRVTVYKDGEIEPVFIDEEDEEEFSKEKILRRFFTEEFIKSLTPPPEE